MSTPTVTRPPARQGLASNASATRTGQPRPRDAAGVVLLVACQRRIQVSDLPSSRTHRRRPGHRHGDSACDPPPQSRAPRKPPTAPAAPSGSAGQERIRRVVAVAMSSLEDLGATALGHISVTRSPGRALARAVRSRGARAVVLDQQAPPRLRRAEADLTGELRRRLHGSGIIVAVASPDRPAPRHAVLPWTKPAGARIGCTYPPYPGG